MFINQSKNNKSYFMSLALKQANFTLGNTKDNPSVGCIIVKNNNVISAGFTSIKGKPHAEHNALKSAKKNVKGSDLYVTLEPCSNYGKTSPCINKIINKKINKVFFSIHDPDKRSFKRARKKLKDNNISNKVGILDKETNYFYRSYIKFKNDDLPFVTCKLALSKDHFSIHKKKKWLTNRFSRGRVHLMRSNHDCIITSSNTVISDNPKLTCRIDGLIKRSPTRVLLDRNLKIKITSKIIQEAKKYKTIIFYNRKNIKKIKLLKKFKVKTFQIILDIDGNLDLKASLIKIKKLGFSRIFLESGVKLIKSFLKKNLVDDLKLFISNKSINSAGKGNIKKDLLTFIKRKKPVVEKVNLFGEKLLTYKLK